MYVLGPSRERVSSRILQKKPPELGCMMSVTDPQLTQRAGAHWPMSRKLWGEKDESKLTVGVALKIAHLYIVSVPETSTLVTLVDEADVVVVVVGKNILGATLPELPEDEEQLPAVAVLTSLG